jgi:hypothetical protein
MSQTVLYRQYWMAMLKDRQSCYVCVATSPLWQVLSNDSYEKMIKRLNPEPVQSQTQGTPTQNGEPVVFARQSPRLRDLPPISICYSCDLPKGQMVRVVVAK